MAIGLRRKPGRLRSRSRCGKEESEREREGKKREWKGCDRQGSVQLSPYRLRSACVNCWCILIKYCRHYNELPFGSA